MKTIFVSIEEFLANGGILKEGMTIYREEQRQFNKDGFDENGQLRSSIALGELIGKDEGTGCYLVKNASYKSFPLLPTRAFVKIEAKPIYNENEIEAIYNKWYDKHLLIREEYSKGHSNNEVMQMFRSRMRDILEFVSDLKNLK